MYLTNKELTTIIDYIRSSQPLMDDHFKPLIDKFLLGLISLQMKTHQGAFFFPEEYGNIIQEFQKTEEFYKNYEHNPSCKEIEFTTQCKGCLKEENYYNYQNNQDI